MKDFLVANSHLSELYENSYNQKIDAYESAVQEATFKARDIDFANVISVLPEFFSDILIYSNEFDNRLIDIYEINYKLGENVLDLIQKTQEIIQEYNKNKVSKPIEIILKRTYTIPLVFPSGIKNCNNQEDIAINLGKLIAFHYAKSIYLPYLERLKKSEKIFKPISFKKMQNFDNYKLRLNSKSSDDEIICF